MNDMIFSSLKRFRLPAMAAEYRRQEELPASTSLTFDERMLMMTQAEEDARHDKRVARLLRKATLRDSKAALENLDYRPERKLEKSQVARLADCRWIHDGRNMLLTGPCGTGKTYLASAFGRAACRLGYEVKAVRASRLFVDLQIGRGDGSWDKILDILKNHMEEAPDASPQAKPLVHDNIRGPEAFN
jgi:DNA replication protein DnaC